MNNHPTAAALATNEPIIPIIQEKNEKINNDAGHNYRDYVELTRYVNHEKRKERIIPLDSDDKESILRLMKDFDDVTANSRLHLNTAPLRFQYFARCLIGSKRDDWQAVIDSKPQNTMEHFNARIAEFLDMIFVPTDLIDQKNYLMKLKKPYKLSCIELSSRLRYINSLMRWMPGANNTPPFSENDLKVMLFSLHCNCLNLALSFRWHL
ncbi:hypothetical protein IV203_033678 [Nitzschia inconspicua]|uniref:Uncharacterized protein n=1 Tax=Nitzschia inconspicua TaxID=303405 RepID=A0A9K3K5D9_9STRA|nr:hypothetical protein IV203_022864 [Nitzschia inconspicua]KAG7372954.1 hypothetical protein IV203_033678 [Nitzschia inconspicua]